MSTSLGEQLKRLAAPQTTILVDSKKRASILFDQKEAANKDRKTIFDIAHNGLMELVAINPQFLQFEQTLFDRSAINIERSVETIQLNDLLDKAIKKFFYHLSPYFMLQPAHMCIEWLIRRFHIHEFNQNEMMALILPYHETMIFVKCIQIMNFRNPDNRWKWLESIKKPGVPLSKSIVLNRAASDSAFLKFICRTTIESIKELDNRAGTLQVQINFYCTSVIGALENTNEISESHISNILPSILKACSSKVIDFAAAAFMITAQLASKTQLTSNLLNALIGKICTVQFPKMHSDIIVLLILIYQRQNENLKNFPDKSLINLITNKWLTPILAKLAIDEIPISVICVPIVGNCLRRVQTKEENWLACKDFLEKLIIDVHFKEKEAKNLIRAVLDNYHKREIPKISENEVIELDSDDDNDDILISEDVQSWYSEYLQQFERQYPSEFDFTIKETMEGRKNISESRKQALKTVLAFRLKSSYSEDNSLIYENLYHHSARNRTEAVKYLVKNFKTLTITPQGEDMVKDSLLDRLNDDNPKVVNEVLKLSTDNLIQILGIQLFVDRALEILIKTQNQQEDWIKVITNVLGHLTKKSVFMGCDLNRILLALIPFFLPSNDEQIMHIDEILKKDVCDAIPFLKNCSELKKLQKSSEINEKFRLILKSSKNLPEPEEILKSFKEIKENFFNKSSNCSYLLLLLTASFNSNLSQPKIGLNTLQLIEKIIKKYQFHANSKNWYKTIKQNKIPLEIFLDFLLAITKGTKFEDEIEFNIESETVQFILKIHEILLTKSLSCDDEDEKLSYTITLKEFLEILFKNSSEKLEFLANFFIADCVTDLKPNPELQIRSLKLFIAIANGKDQKYTIDELTFVKILLGLSCKISFIRALSLKTLEVIITSDNQLKYKNFSNKILQRKEEILMDSEQFPLILFTMINQNRPKRKSENEEEQSVNYILEIFIRILSEKNSTENYIKANILKILKHINNFNILKNIINLGLEILDYAEENCESSLILDTPRSEIFQLLAQHFDETTITILNNNESAWMFIERSLQLHKFLIETNKKIKSISAVVMDIFEDNVYAKLTVKNKQKLINLILNCCTYAQDNSVPAAGVKLMKRIDLDGKHVIEILDSIKNSCTSPKTKRLSESRKSIAPDPNILNSMEWKCGITLLEHLQNKKKLENYQSLIPILFDMLKKCLDFEEQTVLEYPKQLILSCILHFCQKNTISEDEKKLPKPLPEKMFRMNVVVQCIRGTQNPQTHHHALILLSHCAKIIPQQVLHNMMDIFTFMGSSVVRHDDSFSFQIISNIIESVIPTLVKANSKNASINQDELVVPVLKLFSDIILDVPEHRRLPLYTKLLRTLGATQYLWMFLAVLFESHVMHEDKDRFYKKSQNRLINNSDDFPKRIQLALQITKDFDPIITLETCMSFFTYLRKLPQDKKEINDNIKMDVDKMEITLFDIDGHSSKQLRHYKYIILQFISTLTSSTEFLNSIATLNDDETKSMKSYYQNYIIKILSYIPEVTIVMEKNYDTNKLQFCKVMLHHCYDILDNSISLLSPDMFLIVVNGLMLHQIPAVRKKVIDLLINKLQYKSAYFDNCNEENLLNLLEPLNKIIDTIATKEKFMDNASSSDVAYIQQLSLIAVKLLSKLMAVKHIEEFKLILTKLTKITKKRSTISKIVLAAIVLAITEISSNLRAHSISHLPKFMPLLIEVLQDQAEYLTTQPPDFVCVGIVTGMQKLFETLPLFLGPYIVDVVTSLIVTWDRVLPYQEHESRSTAVINKLKAIWSKISTTVPMRILIPNCEKIYTKLIETKQYFGIAYLMKILIECFDHNSGQDINAHHTELSLFFLQTLEFRIDLIDYKNQIEINQIEDEILKAFVSLILKLSESSFRPLYQKVYDWALRDTTIPDKSITYFLLSSKISEALKSLFVLFASDFVLNAADLLDKCNSIKSDETYFNGINSIEKTEILIENILKTLFNVFLYDSKNFINPHRFDILMQPISDQLENSICLNNNKLQEILLKCISQFALVVSNDTLWKQLNYQVLLKTRSNQPEVRILAFNCCVEIARKLGDDFSSLLPETIPFVAELFEDEQQKVEKNTRKGVQELEKILGESLQKYF